MKNTILLSIIVIILVLMPACVVADQGDSGADTSTPTANAASGTVEPSSSGGETADEGTDDGEPGAPELLESVGERTPMPTATAGVLVQKVSRVTEELGLDEQTILGLGLDDWVILGIAFLLILIVYLFATWTVKRLLPRLARRTSTELDDQLIEVAGKEIRWLVIVLAFQIATVRLVFLSASIKSVLVDVYFLIALGLLARILWQLIDLIDSESVERLEDTDRQQELTPLLHLAVLSSRIIVVIIIVTILLSHFGVNVTAIAAALGLGGLAFSLAARDTIADAIAGIIILIDRPFRVGDRIEIKGLDTWGDVTNIGLRTTYIRTRDNRMVIVPNSTIGNNEIVNYTFPDPEYRIQTHISIAYGTPIKRIQELVLETMQGIVGVLENKPIDVLYHEMGDSAMIFRVRWWIGTYADKRRVFDRVHIALQEAIDEGGLESPFPTQTMNLQIDPQSAGLLRGISSENDLDEPVTK